MAINISQCKGKINDWRKSAEELIEQIAILKSLRPDADLAEFESDLKALQNKITYTQNAINNENNLLDACKFARDRVLMQIEGKGQDINWPDLLEVLKSAIIKYKDI